MRAGRGERALGRAQRRRQGEHAARAARTAAPRRCAAQGPGGDVKGQSAVDGQPSEVFEGAGHQTRAHQHQSSRSKECALRPSAAFEHTSRSCRRELLRCAPECFRGVGGTGVNFCKQSDTPTVQVLRRRGSLPRKTRLRTLSPGWRRGTLGSRSCTTCTARTRSSSESA